MTAGTVSSSTAATLTASYSGVSKTFGVTITPPPAALSSVSVSPSTIVSGQTGTGTVSLTAAAGTGGVVVTLSSSNSTAASVPASVTVPAGLNFGDVHRDGWHGELFHCGNFDRHLFRRQQDVRRHRHSATGGAEQRLGESQHDREWPDGHWNGHSDRSSRDRRSGCDALQFQRHGCQRSRERDRSGRVQLRRRSQ